MAMTALCVCMAWKRAGASISRSMMNFQTFLLSNFTCMNNVRGMTGNYNELIATRHVTPVQLLGCSYQSNQCRIMSVLSVMKITRHA